MSERMHLLKSNLGLASIPLLGGIAIGLAVILGIAIGWWETSVGYIGAWAWWSVFIILIGGVVALVLSGTKAIRQVIVRSREHRFLTSLRADDSQLPEEGGDENQRQLREKMQEAIRTLQQSPELRNKGGIPLYAVPWYLLIGASGSGKTSLLRAVSTTFPPFERPASNADMPTQNCDWWFFNTAIILDTAGSYAIPTQGERDSTQWFRFLQLLRYYRDLLPINGLIVTVGADALATKGQEDLRLEAIELRKRIDEGIRELGVDFPIYILVTRCDAIEGFTEFFTSLPEHVQRQVFGYARETRPGENHPQAATSPVRGLEGIYEQTVERLKQLRLSIFNGEKSPPATLHQKIYCFPEEFRALQQPLRTFVEALVAENPFQHKPFFRALFFSSARQQGTPHSLLRRQLRFDSPARPLQPGTRAYFLHDLLAVILGRDQYLARRTGRAIRGRLFRNLSIFGGGVSLCLLLLFFLTWTFFTDRGAVASVNQEPCTAASGPQGTAPLLGPADECRQVVQGLIDQNRQRFALSKLVFNRSGRLEGELRQRYVEKFHAEVLTPLDAGITQQLIAGQETISLVLSLIKRIELVNKCLSVLRCPHPITDDLQPDYPLMFASASQAAPSAAQVATLRQTYEAYLYWAAGPREVLRQEQAAHADRLRQWFSAKQFAPQQILLWANRKYPPVTLDAFWKGASGGNGRGALQVDGAYTPEAWKQSILPFLQRAADAVPEIEPLLTSFQDDYRRRYFAQWERFLTEFPEGELPWWRTREQRRQLALKLLDEHSPYNRVVDVTFDELKPLLPLTMVAEVSLSQPPAGVPVGKFSQVLSNTWQRVSQLVQRPQPSEPQQAPAAEPEVAVPVWVQALQRYLRSDSRKAYVSTLKEIQQQLGADVPIEKSFQLAQAAFKEGRPSEQSTHPVFKAWWIISRLRAEEGLEGAALEQSFWPLLERPVLIAWKVILEGSSDFLQKAWTDNVVAPTQGLSRIEQVNLLHGPQGKVREFVNQFVSPFLVDNESRPGRLLGEDVPIPAGIMEALRETRRVSPILELKSAHRVRVEAAQDSVITSSTSVVEERTEFILECAAQTFKVRNRTSELTESSTNVFWTPDTCGDVVIVVSLTCDRSCVRRAAAVGISLPEASSFRLIKRYSGQSGFLQFIQDFRGGSRLFGANDFGDDAPTLRRYHINSIRVFYRLDVPDTLTKFMSLILK